MLTYQHLIRNFTSHNRHHTQYLQFYRWWRKWKVVEIHLKEKLKETESLLLYKTKAQEVNLGENKYMSVLILIRFNKR